MTDIPIIGSMWSFNGTSVDTLTPWLGNKQGRRLSVNEIITIVRIDDDGIHVVTPNGEVGTINLLWFSLAESTRTRVA